MTTINPASSSLQSSSTSPPISDPSVALLPSPAANDGITALAYLDVSDNGDIAAHNKITQGNDDTDSSNSLLLLASTSWDGCVRIHDTTDPFRAKLVTQHNMDAGPLLALDTGRSYYGSNGDHSMMSGSGDDDCIFTGGLDGSVKRFHIPSSHVEQIGSHYRYIPDKDSMEENSQDVVDWACSCLCVLNCDAVASAGWDSCFYLWKIPPLEKNKVATNDQNIVTQQPMVKIDLPGKAFSMDSISLSNHSHRIAIATANRRLVIMDVELGPTPSAKIVLDRESSLKYQSRVCRFFPDGTGIAIGSIEGRVAIEFLSELDIEPPQNMKKYAFKCHRQNDIVYPVNDIAFHPKYGTFATGGCDGTVVTWDGLHKKKLTILPAFPTSIAAMAFSKDGKQLAIASSYTFERGEMKNDGSCDSDVHVSNNGADRKSVV